ncbi:MAG: polysaccharide deacetylase family protein [Chitinivibrionales bacterium]|nr:polysaccharide deacetylase family protein [Chitinivibrionales bacterium]
MSRSGKKKTHHCKNHPRKPTRLKCAKCDVWICSSCAEKRNNLFYCKEHIPHKAAPLIFTSDTPPDKTRQSRSRPDKLVILSGITLALCGLVFGLLVLRQNRLLRQENALLRRRRIDLLEYLKESNAHIDSLEHSRAAATHAVDTLSVAPKTKRPFRLPAPYTPKNVTSYRGFPLTFDNGPVEKKLVALTFDGGSHTNAALPILDTLKSRRIPATMFLTGRFIRKYPSIVERILRDGHVIGNHTMSHPHLTSWASDHTHTTLPDITKEVICRELLEANDAFKTRYGKNLAPIWRAPYGERNNVIYRWALECGYLHVGWRQGNTWRENLDSNDWVPDDETPGYHTPAEVYEKITGLAGQKPYGINGGIVLMHLGTVRSDPSRQVHTILGRLIDDLRGQGYTFVSVLKMLREQNIDYRKVYQMSIHNAG